MFKKYCKPAKIYLVISLLSIGALIYQNSGSTNLFCAGNLTCDSTNTTVLYAIQIVYVLFWAWLLNVICESGALIVSWILVLFPILLMFLCLVMFMFFNTTPPVGFL